VSTPDQGERVMMDGLPGRTCVHGLHWIL